MSSRLSMNTTFRPRPIDINRPLEIHRGILPSEADGCVRGVPSLPTGMEPEEEEEAHIQEAIAASLAFNPAADIEIPTPICRVVEGYDTAHNPNPYAPGTTYIFYKGDDIENSIEYDLDSDDEQFLTTLNANKKLLSEDKFEFAIDRFEKEVHFHPGQEISLPKAEAILKGAPGGGVRREVLAPLLEHWKEKRAAKDGGSLLVRFMKPPAFDDPSPYVAFRPREKDKEKFKKIRKNDSVALAKMRSLRQEMERSRTLLEMLKKREKLKKDQMTIVAQVFEQLLVELAVKSEDDGRPPLLKKPKKIHHAPTPPSITSPIPSISSPVDHLPPTKPRSTAPKSNRADYFYDIATVNTRLKIDPAQALPPYVLQNHPKPPRSSQTPSSSLASSLYPSFLQTLRRPAHARAQRSAWLLGDEEELSDFEDNDEFLFDDEAIDKSDEEDETVPDFAAEIAKLDENAFFPRKIDGYISTSRTSTPFRGRARLGRGGRILFDRPIRFTPPPPTSLPPPTPPIPVSTSPLPATSLPPPASPVPPSASPAPPSTSPLPSASSPMSASSTTSTHPPTPSLPPTTSPLPSATSPIPSSTSPVSSSASPFTSSTPPPSAPNQNHTKPQKIKTENHTNSHASYYENLDRNKEEREREKEESGEESEEKEEREEKKRERGEESEEKEEKEEKEEREEKKRERERERDVEMADNESDNEGAHRSSSPVNSEPEARLLFTHRASSLPPRTSLTPSHPPHTSPTPSSLPPRTSPKLFYPTSPLSYPDPPNAPVLPTHAPPSPSPPLSPSASCIDKMPVLHTYSKKQQNSQKRKFVDTLSM